MKFYRDFGHVKVNPELPIKGDLSPFSILSTGGEKGQKEKF